MKMENKNLHNTY